MAASAFAGFDADIDVDLPTPKLLLESGRVDGDTDVPLVVSASAAKTSMPKPPRMSSS